MQDVTMFMEALGLNEDPMGLFYTDQKPAAGISPKRQLSLEQMTPGSNHDVNWSCCMLSKVRYARRKNCAAFFDHAHYGCLGGAFFMGFKSWYAPFEPALISTGIPGQIQGERYLDSAETGRRFYEGFQPPEAGGRVLVIQPLELFTLDQTPEVVLFFPTRDSMIGLNALTVFLTGDPDAVCMPFGMGCASLVSWPRRFSRQGETKAVIGGFDINCIRYLKKQELTYAVPYALFLKMVKTWPDTILGTRAWQRIKQRRLEPGMDG